MKFLRVQIKPKKGRESKKIERKAKRGERRKDDEERKRQRRKVRHGGV